jgi:hypothetical protein
MAISGRGEYLAEFRRVPSSLGRFARRTQLYSDDFIIWESWGSLGDYFIRPTGISWSPWTEPPGVL